MAATVFITGNVTSDPQVKMIGKAQAVIFDIGFTVGKNEDGTWEGNYYKCTLYGLEGEKFMEKVQRGSNISIHGTLLQETYKKKDGTTATAMKVKVEGKIEYHKNLKGEDGSGVIRSSNNKPNYENVKARKMADSESAAETPW